MVLGEIRQSPGTRHHDENLESEESGEVRGEETFPWHAPKTEALKRTAWLRVLTESMEEYRRKTDLALR